MQTLNFSEAEADTISVILSVVIAVHRVAVESSKTYSRLDRSIAASHLSACCDRPCAALRFHIISSLVELLLYYTGFECSLVAVFACLTQAATSMLLTKRVVSGYKVYTSEPISYRSMVKNGELMTAQSLPIKLARSFEFRTY